MCLLHDSEEYGILRWPLKELAEAVSCRPAELASLASKGVLKGADAGQQCEAFTYTPRHAGKDGEPVILVPAQVGPVWFSSRMVKDEYIRSRRGDGSRFGDEPKAAPDTTPKPPIGAHKGYGPSSSSSSSSSKETERPRKRGSRLPQPFPLSPEWNEAARVAAEGMGKQLGAGQITLEFNKFCDHWWGKSGRDATKEDWLATWRNWVRRAIEYGAPVTSQPPAKVAAPDCIESGCKREGIPSLGGRCEVHYIQSKPRVAA